MATRQSLYMARWYSALSDEAYRQVAVLDAALDALLVRFRRASADSDSSFAVVHYNRLQVQSAVRDRYFEYAEWAEHMATGLLRDPWEDEQAERD